MKTHRHFSGRPWLSTREVMKRLELSQQRITQLRQDGELVGELDEDGRWQYDRVTVEELADRRREARERRTADASERQARRAERADAFLKEQKRRKQLAAERQRELDDLRRRAVSALETIATAINGRRSNA